MIKNLQSKVLLLVGLLLAGVSGAWAEDVTYSFTISASDFNTTSYAANNNEKTSNAVCTTDNTKTYEVKWTSYQVMKSGNDMQWQKSKGYIYNSTDLGTINSVTINSSDGSFTTYYGTEEKPTSGNTVGNGFFNTVVGSKTGKTSNVVVTFTISEGGDDVPGDQSVATTVTIDDENITNTDVYVNTVAGSLSATVLDNDSKAIDVATVTWSGNNDDVATIDANTGAVTLVAAGTVTFTATYAGVDNEYKASSATYEMTVTSSAPYVQPTEFDIALGNGLFGTNYNGSVSNVTDENPVVGTLNEVKVTYAGSGNHYVNNSQIRFYPNNKLTFEAPEGYNITKIVFTSGGTWAATISTDEGTYTSSTKTWEGETTTVLFTGSGSSRCDMTNAAITLEAIVPQVLSSIALSGNYPTTFHVGDAFSYDGMVVTATYESGKTADVTAEATFTGYDMNNTGVQTVTVSYTENEVTQTADYEITVNAPATLTSISLSGDYPTEFQQGDAFSSEGIVVTANYDDETTSDVTADAIFSGYDMSTIGQQTVTVTYQDKTATYDITVTEKKGTEDNPYTVAEAIAFINTLGSATSSEEVYVSGIISKVDSYNSKYSSITYWISDDGTTTGQMEVYSGKGLDGADFSAVTDLAIGDIVTVKGYVKMYDTTPEFTQNSQLVSHERPVITDPYIEVSTNDVEATAAGAEGTITVSYNNITEVAAEVKFYEVDGTTPATYDWIEAEIDAQTNNVEYIIAENESTEARTAYMKVYALGDEAEDVYSELITISQAGYVVDYATLPFAFDKGATSIASTKGLSQNGLGSDYAASPKLKFDGTGDYVILKINEVPGTLTFDIKGNNYQYGTFTLQASADGVNYEDLKTYGDELGSTQSESFDLDSDVRYIKWVYTEKVNGNVGVGNIVLTAPISVSLNAYGYATYASNFVLDFTTAEANGYSAWAISEINGNTIRFIKITESVAGGTGVLLMGEVSDNVSLHRGTDATYNGDNLLEGIIEDTQIEAGQYYGLSGNSFVKVGATTIPAGKALLPAELIDTNNTRLTFLFDDEATGIVTLSHEEAQKTVYDLQGRKIQNPGSGIYVVEGRKVVLK